MTEIHKKYTDFISVMVVLVVLIPTLGLLWPQGGNILVPAWDCFIPLMGLIFAGEIRFV